MEQNKIVVPLAIIIAGVLIAGAIYYGDKKDGNTTSKKDEQKEINIRPVESTDHILGNPDASIVIVEYSDTECPYCKNFHSTMNKIVSEFGKDGKVAWVYRHYPIDQLHDKSRKEAEATECAAELGGNEKFWQYINLLYEKTPSNNKLDPSVLPQIATTIGLDKIAFQTCLNSGKYKDKVERDYQDLTNSGVDKEEIGTPYNVIIVKGGGKIPMAGALPYASVKSAIESASSSN